MLSNLSVAIMMHPARERHLPYLLERLGKETRVFMDAGKLNVWGNAQRAWLSFDPAKQFHLVVQDDALLCDDFYMHLERLLARFGEKAFYGLYYEDRPQRFPGATRAATAGLAQGFFLWAHLHWAGANVYPTWLIPAMMVAGNKVKASIGDDCRRHDGFIRESGLPVVYALPSLADHRPEEDSLIRNGHNSGRRAWRFRA